MSQEGGYVSNLLSQYTTLAITPLWNNIACALLTVIYVKTMLDFTSFMREKIGCADITRKFIHVGAGCWILFWPLFDVNHWSWRLNILVPTVMSIKLFFKGAILKDPDDADVRTMSRGGSPAELLYGPLQFTLFMMWVGTQKFMTVEGAILVAGLGVGDGVAPLVGKYYGRLKYRFPLGGQKSMEGSFFGVFLGTAGGTMFFIKMLALPMLSHENVVKIAAIATIVEATSPEGFDNVVIPSLLHFCLEYQPSLLSSSTG
eukprot:CAMPEP_0197247862 /NCGR_PEP_ID=MMETSP1429-20130617/32522_1 /TAXON_ID=49237 /ORGANISM="Chaetoceros  sp., Strain UNC1202" /LENGTH=258 /DNA_ID=CAMNT_0042708895 /DNA_START=17 /DNA_END=793 /DNA_ORIENTATION=+